MIDWSEAFLILGIIVSIASFLAFFVRFSEEQEEEQREAFAVANIDTLRGKAMKANEALAEGLKLVEASKQHAADKHA
jgi:NNP family nitrate/nitrite transporter-like MFS transporter